MCKVHNAHENLETNEKSYIFIFVKEEYIFKYLRPSRVACLKIFVTDNFFAGVRQFNNFKENWTAYQLRQVNFVLFRIMSHYFCL